MADTRFLSSSKRFDQLHYGHLVVLFSFIILLVIYGIHYTFGLYLKPILNEFGWSRSAVSGAYSLSWLLQGPSSILMGRLNDKYGPRLVLSFCGILLFSGIILTTQVSADWHLYLTYGVITGIGTGGAFVPIVSTIARWFTEKRAMMTGIAISGMGFGTFLLSPVANYLISHYSWRTSYTVLGIVLLCVILLVAQFLRLNNNHASPDGNAFKTIDAPRRSTNIQSSTLRKALSQSEFWKAFCMLFCFGYCLMAIMVHIAAHAVDIGKTTAVAAGLVSAIGISSIAGKIAFGYSGDRIGSRKIYMICFCITLLSLLLLVFSNTTLLLLLFAVIFGLSYGGKACSLSPLTAEMYGLRSHGAIMGALNMGFTSGATVGPFMTGFLFDKNGDYFIAFLVAGLFSLLGLALAVGLKSQSRFNPAKSG